MVKIGSRKILLSKFKFTESYISLILGAIVVLVIGILFFSFAKGSRTTQTSSVNEGPNIEEQMSQDNKNISSTYTIKQGDDLWSISKNVYNNGYKWVEIAKVNNLENPGLIHVGNKLTIPTVSQKEPVSTNKIMENNSIDGNTYTIKPGDNLWDISVRAYGDGYRWVELAKINNLENPDLIYSGNVLNLPR